MSISSAVDPSAVSRAVGIRSQFTSSRGGRFNLLPQRLALIGQGSTDSVYSATKAVFTSALAVAAAYGFGSPLHLAARQLLPDNGDGIGLIPLTVYPLADAVSSVAATGTITPSGTQTVAAAYTVSVNGVTSVPFVIAAAATVAARTASIKVAINATLNMPVTAVDGTTVVNLTSKWKGVSANDLYVSVSGSATAGTAFAVVQPSGGLLNPSVQTALDQFGETWETMVLNCLNIADTTNLDLYSTFGEARWNSIPRRPLVVFTGNTIASVSSAVSVSNARTLDRTNAQLVLPGSKELPFVVAARELARIIYRASVNPAHDYGSMPADGLTPGTDAQQWSYTDREIAVTSGSSTVKVRDGVPYVSDVVTFYHPAGDSLPPYRFVVDIVKLQNAVYNFDLEFESAEWDGAPLIPDGQPTLNATAKTPGAAVAAAAAITDLLAEQAILADPASTKAGIAAEIDATNPKRINLVVPIKIAGNSNIISLDLNWSFNFASSI
jgi:phage tail sheath gpL-like